MARRRVKVTKEQIKEAFEKTGGIITTTAKMLGVGRQYLYRRLEKDEDLRKARESAEEKILDLTESKLIEQIKEGNLSAIIFYLKCKGKKRGWIERQEIDNIGETIIKIKKPGDLEDGE